jgi:hypothetical protein
MKSLRSPAVAALLLLSCHALAFDNEPDGFRGVTWGSEFAANEKDFTLKEDAGEVQFYLRKEDKMAIGGAELSAVVYSYWRSRFSGVRLGTEGVANKTALIDAFREQFGEPERPNRFMDRYFWMGGKTLIIIDCNPINHKCNASLDSAELFEALQAEKKKAASESSRDF